MAQINSEASAGTQLSVDFVVVSGALHVGRQDEEKDTSNSISALFRHFLRVSI